MAHTHRFLNGARLSAYAGLAPVNRRSGKSINRVSQHRGGNHRLKNAMFIAAFVASQHDPEVPPVLRTVLMLLYFANRVLVGEPVVVSGGELMVVVEASFEL